MAGSTSAGRTAARWSRELVTSVGATGRNVRSGELSTRVAQMARFWRYLGDGTLPEARLIDLFPGIGEVRSATVADNTGPFELMYGERLVLDVLVRHLRPARIFEFGTYRGTTTRLLAEAADPGAEIHTVDVPTVPGTPAHDVIGSALVEPVAPGRTIVQHRHDTRTFDFAPYAASFDLVFVDGGHDYDVVLSDSRNALEIVRPGGVVVWDDYTAGQMGVVDALGEIGRTHPLRHVAWTRLAALVT